MQEAVTGEVHGGYGTPYGGMHKQILEMLGSPSKAIGRPQDLRYGIDTYEHQLVDQHNEKILAGLVLAVWKCSHQGTPVDHPHPKEAHAWKSWLHYMYCSDTIHGWMLRKASRCVTVPTAMK